jgi:hypothetical protein
MAKLRFNGIGMPFAASVRWSAPLYLQSQRMRFKLARTSPLAIGQLLR